MVNPRLNADMSPEGWVYDRVDQIRGHDEVTLHFHRRSNIAVQTKVTLPDGAAIPQWWAEHHYPGLSPLATATS